MTMEQEPDYEQFDEVFDIKESINGIQSKNRNLKLYMILDTTADSDLFADFKFYEPEAEFEIIFDNLVEAEPSPVVISLNPDSKFLTYITEREEEFTLNLAILYLSDIELSKQMPHWQQSLFVRDTTDELLLFRYYDPRVLTGYLSVSTPQEQAMMMGPMNYFWVIDEGDWIGLGNPDPDYADKFSDDSTDHEVNLSTPPIMLREAHITEADRLAQINMVDVIIDYIRNEDPKLIDSYTTDELEPMVLSAIYRAKKYDIDDEASLCTWAMLMFDISPSFDEQTNINRALKNKSIKPNKRIEYALDTTSDDDWEEASELYRDYCCDPDHNLENLKHV